MDGAPARRASILAHSVSESNGSAEVEQLELQARLAAEGVPLRREDGIDRRAEGELAEARAGAEGEGLQDVVPLAELEQQVVLLGADRARGLGQVDLAREEDRGVVVGAEGSETLQVLHPLARHVLERQLAIDLER